MEIKQIMPQNRDAFLRENMAFFETADLDLMPVASDDYIIFAEEEGNIIGILQAYERELAFYVHRFFISDASRRTEVADALYESLHMLAEEMSVKTILQLFACEEAEAEGEIRFFEEYGFSNLSARSSFYIAEAAKAKMGPLLTLSDPDTDIGTDVPLIDYQANNQVRAIPEEIKRLEKDAQLLLEYSGESRVIVDVGRARAAILAYRLGEKAPLQILNMALPKKEDTAYLCELLYRMVAACDTDVTFPCDSPEKEKLFAGLLKGCDYKVKHIYSVEKTLYSLDSQPITGYNDVLIRLQAMMEYLALREIASSIFVREGFLPYLRFENGNDFVECMYYPKEGEGGRIAGFALWCGVRPKDSAEALDSYTKTDLVPEGLGFDPEEAWKTIEKMM